LIAEPAFKASAVPLTLQSSMPTRTPLPDLSLPLAQPIILTHGPRSYLVTLMDAAILIRAWTSSGKPGRCGTARSK
jgi:hypothetical protein